MEIKYKGEYKSLSSFPIRNEENKMENFVPALDHIKNCSLPVWYPIFRKHTIESVIIPVDADFISYLESDGIYMPLSADGNDADDYEPYKRDHDSEYDDDDGDHNSEVSEKQEASSSESDLDGAFNFTALQAEISRAIQRLGGCVFPKLDWSSTRDACWISTYGVPKCHNYSEMLVLLKSSDFINHDLTVAKRYEGSEDAMEYQHHLVLRKWIHDLNAGMEFRCIVIDDCLFGVTQRDVRTFYEYLPGQVDSLSLLIAEFWNREVNRTFGEKYYTMDVYVNLDRNSVVIIDFNPLIPETDLYLFNNEDLHGYSKESDFEFRVIKSKQEAIEYGSNAPMFSTSMLPQEAVMMSQGVTLDDFAREMQHQMQRQFES